MSYGGVSNKVRKRLVLGLAIAAICALVVVLKGGQDGRGFGERRQRDGGIADAPIPNQEPPPAPSRDVVAPVTGKVQDRNTREPLLAELSLVDGSVSSATAANDESPAACAASRQARVSWAWS